ncbi:Crossover junction endonuclease mus81 [Podila epigama]|nr:Crossover junction endonuclease mus81 [Podila epigama]
MPGSPPSNSPALRPSLQEVNAVRSNSNSNSNNNTNNNSNNNGNVDHFRHHQQNHNHHHLRHQDAHQTATNETFAARFSDFVRSSDHRQPVETYMDEDDQFHSVLTAIANIQMAQRPRPPVPANINVAERNAVDDGPRSADSSQSMQYASAEILNSDDEHSDSTIEDIYDLRHIMVHNQRQYEARIRQASSSDDDLPYEPSHSTYSDRRDRHPQTSMGAPVSIDIPPFHSSNAPNAAFAVESNLTPPPPTMISSSYFSPTTESTIVLSSPPPGRLANMATFPTTPPNSYSTTAAHNSPYSSASLGNGPYRRFVTGRDLGRYERPPPPQQQQQQQQNQQQQVQIGSQTQSTTSASTDEQLDANGGQVLNESGSNGGIWSAYGSVTLPIRSFEQHRQYFYEQQERERRRQQRRLQQLDAVLQDQTQSDHSSMEGIEVASDGAQNLSSRPPPSVSTASLDPHRRTPLPAMSAHNGNGPQSFASGIPIPSRYVNPMPFHNSQQPSYHLFRPHNISTGAHNHVNMHSRPSSSSQYDSDIDAIAARYRRRSGVDIHSQTYSETVERAEAGGWSSSNRYDNPLSSSRGRNRYLEIGLKEVVRMACRFCESIICERGMKAQLLADQAIGLFSTDDPPQSVQLIGNDYKPTNCNCRIRDTASENNGHLWLFHPEYIFSGPRLHHIFARQMRWEDLPNPEQDYDALSIGKVFQGGPNGRLQIGGMAYESMAKYPTKFIHPAEALCLTGVGEKIVSMLEAKLAKHCKDNNIPMPTTKQAKRIRRTDPLAPQVVEEPKPKRPRAKKPYVPGIRTGAYGILLSLYDAQLQHGGEHALTKDEIISKAQVYCDASYTNPDHGKLYAAWSAMKSLTEKNIVYMNGRNYYLTEEGKEIALTLRRNAQGRDANVTPLDPSELEPQPSASSAIARPGSTASSRTSSSSSGTIATNSWTGDSTNPSPLTSRSASSSSFASNSISKSSYPSWQETSYDFDYEDTFRERSWSPMHDAVMSPLRQSNSASTAARTPSLSSKPPVHSSSSSLSNSSKSNQPQSKESSRHSIMVLSDSEDDIKDFGTSQYSTTSSATLAKSFSSTSRTSNTLQDSIDTDDNYSASQPLSRSQSSGMKRTSSSSSIRVKTGPVPISDHDSFQHLQIAPTRILPKAAQVDIPTLAKFQPIEFHPGTFDVILLLDNREVRTLTDRDYFQQRLKENGVRTETRVLDIGDVTWIAKRKQPSDNDVNEIVLDYIIERKRMDDLVFSIKDGRFTEQKFRLKKSGIENVIYLVETYKNDENYDIGPDAIRTAQISTQITDGFFLKRTNHIDQTIDYLTSITNILKRKYEGQTLFGLPDNVIERSTYLELKDYLKAKEPERSYLPSYASFSRLNSKSSTVVVRDMFAKILLTLRGVSAEKASEIVRMYGTPRRLFSNLDEGGDSVKPAQRRSLVARSCTGILRKKIGPAISAKVADMWYLDPEESE